MPELQYVVATANDGDLQQRFIAAAAAEQIPSPDSWVLTHRWELAAQDTATDGLLDAYQYAIDTDVHRVKMYGKDPGIINDAKILSVVQAVKNAPTE